MKTKPIKKKSNAKKPAGTVTVFVRGFPVDIWRAVVRKAGKAGVPTRTVSSVAEWALRSFAGD